MQSIFLLRGEGRAQAAGFSQEALVHVAEELGPLPTAVRAAGLSDGHVCIWGRRERAHASFQGSPGGKQANLGEARAAGFLTTQLLAEKPNPVLPAKAPDRLQDRDEVQPRPRAGANAEHRGDGSKGLETHCGLCSGAAVFSSPKEEVTLKMNRQKVRAEATKLLEEPHDLRFSNGFLKGDSKNWTSAK